MRLSGPEGNGVFDSLRSEILGTVLRHLLRGIFLAAEYIYERPVGVLSEVPGDQGGLDKLCQGIALHPRVGPEADHDRLPESLHVDMLAEVYGELCNDFLAADLLGIAIMKVYRGQQTPLLPLLESFNYLLITQKLARSRTHAIHFVYQPPDADAS